MSWTPPTQAEVEQYFDRLNNWGRWGNDDRRGTLNLITSEKRRGAMQLGQGGRVVSLARDITPNPTLDYQMLYPGHRGGSDVSKDYFGLVFHGTAYTHLDALCHISYQGKLYNGRPFEDNLNPAGAAWGALDAWFDGVTTRGVLLDVAALRPEGYVTQGNPVTPGDLDAAAARAGVRVEPGDVVVVRSGDEAFRRAHPDWTPRVSPHPGLHMSCITWFREKDIAAIAWDMMDERPIGYAGFGMGTHMAIPFLGLVLIDNSNPEPLATACQQEGRYEFLFTAAPLPLVGSTGAPTNPLAIF